MVKSTGTAPTDFDLCEACGDVVDTVDLARAAELGAICAEEADRSCAEDGYAVAWLEA